MVIRPATPADLPAIAALHAENWRRDYAGILPAEALGAALDLHMAEKWNPDRLSEGAVLVLRDLRGLAGFVALYPEHPDGVYVDNLHVQVDRRGFGYGKALMHNVARFAQGRAVWLVVLAANTQARRIYAEWGATEGPVFDDEELGAKVPALKLTWTDPVALADRTAEPAP